MQWGYLLVFDGTSFDIGIGRWDSYGESVSKLFNEKELLHLKFVLQFPKPVKSMFYTLQILEIDWLSQTQVTNFPNLTQLVSVEIVIILSLGKSQISALSLNNLKDNCFCPPGHLGLDIEHA